MRAVYNLVNSYYIRGFFGPFFIFVFPILLLFIMGNAMDSIAKATPSPIAYMSNVIAGVMITSLISNGLIGLPTTIIEFKKSTLMKRIGAAHISKRTFFIAVLVYQLGLCVLSVLWTLLWGAIIIGTKSGYDWSVSFNSNFGIALPFILLTIMTSMSMGMLIVSFLNTQQGVMGVSNVIYFPISFLSGAFMPKAQIDGSPILNGISYALPTKYVVDPFFSAFINGKSGLDALGYESYVFPIIAICFCIVALGIAVKKFKWSN